MKIRKQSIHKLRNDAHFQLLTEVNDLITRTNPETLNIKPLFEGKFLPLYRKEDSVLKTINKSAITKRIQDADRDRDETFYGMVEVNSGNMKHFDPAVKESARVLGIVFKTYGNVARKPLNEETSAIYNLLQDLNSKYAADVARVGLAPWVIELQNRNAAFDNLMKERYDEEAAKCEYSMKEVRVEVDEVLFAMIDHINADTIMDNSETFVVFIKTLNAIFAKFKRRKYSLNPDAPDSPDLEDGGTDDADDGTDDGTEELEELGT